MLFSKLYAISDARFFSANIMAAMPPRIALMRF
jgi:hypothetical protein